VLPAQLIARRLAGRQTEKSMRKIALSMAGAALIGATSALDKSSAADETFGTEAANAS